MKFKYDPRAGRMVGTKIEYLQRYEIEELGGVVPTNRHINPGTGYIPERELMSVKMKARRSGVELLRLNGYDKDIGGNLYRFERTKTFESKAKEMKKVSETAKVTITMGQLKKLIKESTEQLADILAYCRKNIYDFASMERDALDEIDHSRCSLQQASPELYDSMLDAIEEYCDEEGIENDFDPEDVFWA